MPVNKEEANALLDWYAPLLTDRQADIMTLYYREDLSLSEIAENLSISRSAVHDQISRGDKQLADYESKMHLLERYQKRLAVYHTWEQSENQQVQELVRQLANLE